MKNTANAVVLTVMIFIKYVQCLLINMTLIHLRNLFKSLLMFLLRKSTRLNTSENDKILPNKIWHTSKDNQSDLMLC